MRITTTKTQLIEAITICEKIVGKKESLPVLSCIVISANSHIVTLEATNLESRVVVTVPAHIEQEGSVAIPATTLSQVIRMYNSDSILLEVKNDVCIISNKKTKNTLKTISLQEFPLAPHVSVTNPITVKKDILLAGIQSVIYAASPSMIRPELGSIYMKGENDTYTTVATDSFRLAEKKQSVYGIYSFESLIPLRYTHEIIHILQHISDEELALHTTSEESSLTITTPMIRYSTRVIDGQFPNYKEIIPKEFSTHIRVLKTDLLDILRKARVFSHKENSCSIHINATNNTCTLSAKSQEVGEMDDVIDGTIEGENLDIKFHIPYVTDCIGSIQSDSVMVSFAGAGKPAVIQGVSNDSFRYLVMPLNR